MPPKLSVLQYFRLAVEKNGIGKKKKKKKHSMNSPRRKAKSKRLEALIFPETEGGASTFDDEEFDSSDGSLPGHRDPAVLVATDHSPVHEGGSFKQEGNGDGTDVRDTLYSDRGIRVHDYAQDDPDAAAILLAAEFNNDNPAKDPDYEEHVSKRRKRSQTASGAPIELTEGERMIPPCSKCCRAMASMKGPEGLPQLKWMCFKIPGRVRCSCCYHSDCFSRYTSSETEIIQRWVDKFIEFEKNPSEKLEAEALALGTCAIDAIPTVKEFGRRRAVSVERRRAVMNNTHSITGSTYGNARKPAHSPSPWSPRKSTSVSRSPKKSAAATAPSSGGREQTELLRRILNATEKQAEAVSKLKDLFVEIVDGFEKE